ncbi:redoxin domain-containing protein [Piscibacillus halophilus]|uniref:Peroxiredoxin n=1 Tax=Piscibacillus halophilus TaxID=571933 RepID=A0A1H8Z9L0_9BACI|nr:redoxin domain-containing protein [Piscibacillus halophilus]SEP61115.1 Peroxiredoxin [Piscibacillus halophilus]
MIWKRIFAVGFIITLLSIVVYNTLLTNETGEEENDSIFIVPEGMDVESGGTEVGDLAPNFQLETMEGETVQLEDYKGKKVFLNFWASWCGPCKEEMPHMQEFHEKYGDEVAILAVNTNEPVLDNAREFVEEYELTFPILLDETTEVAARYKVPNLPTTYFINSEGEIQIQRKSGPMTFEEMEEKMKELD